MDPHFGVGMRRFIFEQDHPSIYAEISAKITQQVAKYLSYIDIEHIDFDSQGMGNSEIASNTVIIKIIFNIKPLNRRAMLEVPVSA